MPVARIKLSSTDPEKMNGVIEKIKEIANKLGVSYSGPIPFPTKRLKIPVRKSPTGRGRETFETWEMRIHKRLINIGVDERALRMIMKIQIPKEVNVEIEVVE